MEEKAGCRREVGSQSRLAVINRVFGVPSPASHMVALPSVPRTVHKGSNLLSRCKRTRYRGGHGVGRRPPAEFCVKIECVQMLLNSG